MVGIDPRFVGRSTPLHCDWTTDTFIRSAGPNRSTYEQSVALAGSLAAGCVRNDENLLPYATTRNTARDMDLVRAVLGARTISYWSGSYGAYLGAVYTQMFGDRVDRFVLDSSPDPDIYGAGVFAGNGPADTAALAHFAGWAAGRDAMYGRRPDHAVPRAAGDAPGARRIRSGDPAPRAGGCSRRSPAPCAPTRPRRPGGS